MLPPDTRLKSLSNFRCERETNGPRARSYNPRQPVCQSPSLKEKIRQYRELCWQMWHKVQTSDIGKAVSQNFHHNATFCSSSFALPSQSQSVAQSLRANHTTRFMRGAFVQEGPLRMHWNPLPFCGKLAWSVHHIPIASCHNASFLEKRIRCHGTLHKSPRASAIASMLVQLNRNTHETSEGQDLRRWGSLKERASRFATAFTRIYFKVRSVVMIMEFRSNSQSLTSIPSRKVDLIGTIVHANATNFEIHPRICAKPTVVSETQKIRNLTRRLRPTASRFGFCTGTYLEHTGNHGPFCTGWLCAGYACGISAPCRKFCGSSARSPVGDNWYMFTKWGKTTSHQPIFWQIRCSNQSKNARPLTHKYSKIEMACKIFLEQTYRADEQRFKSQDLGLTIFATTASGCQSKKEERSKFSIWLQRHLFIFWSVR